MQRLLIVLLCMTIFLSGCQQEIRDNASLHPNIIMIITDDQGYGDLAFHGNPVIKTPTLDSLARASTRLTSFYVSPVCAPTRSSLMTGRYSIRTGVYDTYNGGAIMSDKEITLAEYLKKAGYNTGIFGKWHLGDTYPYRPIDQGFDVSYVHAGGGIGQPGDFYENFIKGDSSYFNPILSFNGEKINTSGYCSDVFTDYAIDFIQSQEDAPYFVYLSYNAPHTPLQLPDHYYKMYRDVSRQDLEKNVKEFRLPLSDKDLEDARKVYGMVSNIDDNLKRLFSEVKQTGKENNTLVIFLTDNGPQQNRYNGGLRSSKGSVYEGGIRVPSFWSWSGKIPADREIDKITSHMDIVPTILDICNISGTDNPDLDGMSLWPALEGNGEISNQRTLFHYWVRGYIQPYWNIAVRSGNHKLVGHGSYTMDNSEFELYDLNNDWSEINDISTGNPDTVNHLKEKFDKWYSEVIRSPNLDLQRIYIGTEHENPVILGRNDTKGPMAKRWMDPTALGYWDAKIVNAGLYTVTIRLFEKVGPGSLTFRAGPVQRMINIEEDSTSYIRLENIKLLRGDCMVEAWYTSDGTFYAPILIEIEKMN